MTATYHARPYPQRIVCLTAETAEIAFECGAADRVVGVTGYAVRPPGVRDKPRVSAYTSVKWDKLRALEPDLILAFSDMQADLVAQLVREGYNVLATNQRTLQGTLEAITVIGAAIGCAEQAARLARRMVEAFDEVARRAAQYPVRPRVYFEEWHDPLIAGVGWTGELVELAGGVDVFAEWRDAGKATDRMPTPEMVIAREPDIIMASWCGRKVNIESIRARPGWQAIPAVIDGEIHEVKSADILAPGPSLVHGLRALDRIISGWVDTHAPGAAQS